MATCVGILAICAAAVGLAEIPTLSPTGASLLAASVLLAALYALRTLRRRAGS